MITLYGITNCDQVKRAKLWLQQKRVTYSYHDFRKDGIRHDVIENWIDQVGWETLVNRRGTTWRQLPRVMRETIDSESVCVFFQEYPTVIKRPVLCYGSRVVVGFSDNIYEDLIGA